MDEALAGDDEPVPVAQRPWFRPVLDAATRGELFDASAAVCCLIGARAAMLFEVCRRAADQGPETRAIWKTAVSNRRLGAVMVAARLAEIEPRVWPDGSSRRSRLVDGIWMLNDPSRYEALVTQRGWDEPSFTQWLSATCTPPPRPLNLSPKLRRPDSRAPSVPPGGGAPFDRQASC
jgi:hypothetical protein